MIQRHILPLLRQSFADFPAVLLIGARQAGKSTLAQQLVQEGLLERYLTLDDLSVLEAARADPDGFLGTLKGAVALDEIQRVPDLMRALKKSIDADRRPGRFLLTGSANVLAQRQVVESLAGRMDVVTLEGLSAGELLGQTQSSPFIEEVLTSEDLSREVARLAAALAAAPQLDRDTLHALVFYGGFPEVALKRSQRFAARWFAAYQSSYIERDVRDLSRIGDVVAFGKLLRLAGLRTGNLLNVRDLGMDAGLDQRTAGHYLELLELTFQMTRLVPWHGNQGKRLVRTPKLFCNDSGLASHLCGLDDPDGLARHPLGGALLETWVFAELRKLLSLHTSITASFYRTHAGREVDFVLERGARRCGIEVKLAESVTRHDFKGLLDMQQAMGSEARGVLLYQGAEVLPFSPTLLAVPLRCLL